MIRRISNINFKSTIRVISMGNDDIHETTLDSTSIESVEPMTDKLVNIDGPNSYPSPSARVVLDNHGAIELPDIPYEIVSSALQLAKGYDEDKKSDMDVAVFKDSYCSMPSEMLTKCLKKLKEHHKKNRDEGAYF